MFIQGDVLAFISLLIGSCLSAWSLTIAYGLLFPGKSYVAKLEIQNHPGRCIGRGLAILLTLGAFGVVLIGAAPNPVAKLVGWILVLAIFSVASLGVAGLAMGVGERLMRMAPDMSRYAAFSRGAAFLIVGCIVPLVGWLAFAPALYIASIGAGCKALFTRVEETPPLAQAEPAS